MVKFSNFLKVFNIFLLVMCLVGFVFFLSPGSKLSTGGNNGNGNAVAVTSLELNKTYVSVQEGENFALTVYIYPSNAADKTITWTSSNTGLATVNSSGVVTAKARGPVTITARSSNGKTASCSVTVTAKSVEVNRVSLNKSSTTLQVGDTETLSATVLPSNGADKTITWTSSNTTVATVNSNGVVTAKASGTTIITAKTSNGITATCAVTVTVPVSSLSLNKSSVTLQVGDTETLSATVLPSNATDKTVTWTSSNTTVATVSSSGVITAKAGGMATITARTKNGKTATCTVKVLSADDIFVMDDDGIVLGLTTVGATLSELKIPGYATRIGNNAFRENTKITSVTILNSVKSIGSSAFYNCSKLTSVTIPNSVTSIEYEAFRGCSSLSEVTIPDSVTSIEYEAFRGCSSLSEVTIPDSVTSLGSGAFRDCSSLSEVTIPDSVTSIGEWAFRSCSSLEGVTIGRGVTQIGGEFIFCSRLKNITITNSITEIVGDAAFIGCNDLKNIHFIGTIDEWVAGITGLGFLLSTYGSSNKNLYINNELVTDVNITVATKINSNVFTNFTCLESVTIGNSVTSIGDYAFSGCSSLSTVTFKNTTGWKAGDTALSSSSLSKPAVAATYLKSTYVYSIWSRS